MKKIISRCQHQQRGAVFFSKTNQQKPNTATGGFQMSEYFIAIKLEWTLAVILIPNSDNSVLQSAVNNFFSVSFQLKSVILAGKDCDRPGLHIVSAIKKARNMYIKNYVFISQLSSAINVAIVKFRRKYNNQLLYFLPKFNNVTFLAGI